MRQRGIQWISIRLCVLVVVILGLEACKRTPSVGEDPVKADDTAGQTDCSPSTAVVQGWAADDFPFPTEVNNEPNPDDCDFYRFAWQEFIQLLKQDEATGGSSVFLTWPNDTVLFPPTGAPPAWSTQAQGASGRQLNKAGGLVLAGQATGDEALGDHVDEAATLSPLVDPNGNLSYFQILVNKWEYEYIANQANYPSGEVYELYKEQCFNSKDPNPPDNGNGIDLPPNDLNSNNSVELKMAWRVLNEAEQTELAGKMLIVPGVVGDDSTSATVGLAGLHITTKTPDNKDWVWATFEHVYNDPDCQPWPPADKPTNPITGAPAAVDWLYYTVGCTDPNGEGRCERNYFCTPCAFPNDNTTYAKFGTTWSAVNQSVMSTHSVVPRKYDPNVWNLPAEGTPFNCTPYPNVFGRLGIALYDPDTCHEPLIPTQVCRAVAIEPGGDIGTINEAVVAAFKDATVDWQKLLPYYELVGVTWHDAQGNEPPGVSGLGNTLMETYLQNLTVGTATGCFVCHDHSFNKLGSTPAIAAGLASHSFTFRQVRQTGPDSVCSTPSSP